MAKNYALILSLLDHVHQQHRGRFLNPEALHLGMFTLIRTFLKRNYDRGGGVLESLVRTVGIRGNIPT